MGRGIVITCEMEGGRRDGKRMRGGRDEGSCWWEVGSDALFLRLYCSSLSRRYLSLINLGPLKQQDDGSIGL